jgi:hypothetical protein
VFIRLKGFREVYKTPKGLFASTLSFRTSSGRVTFSPLPVLSNSIRSRA